MRTLLADLRYGFQLLRQSPGFTTIAVLALALGISANTAIVQITSVRNSVEFKKRVRRR
jgi:putative ABC transport system permease protein